MGKYVVGIEETIVEEYEVEANGATEALDIAKKKYNDGEFVLQPGQIQFKRIAIIKPHNETIIWSDF